MNTGTLIQAPAVELRVLWADDDPSDLVGERRELEWRGHTVVSTVDFESTSNALTNESFDLLILDQQMPKGGRKADDAGSRLVMLLMQGEFGERNVGIPFLFITASAEWVLNCKIDVTGLTECLGIEEKGDDLIGPLEECLAKISATDDDWRNDEDGHPQSSLEKDDGERGDGETGDSDPESVAEVRTEEWKGVVLDVGDDAFRARLTLVGAPAPDHEAKLPLDVVSDRDRAMVVEGVTFLWTIGLQDTAGERATVSRIRLDEQPAISQEEIDDVLAHAAERKRQRDDTAG